MTTAKNILTILIATAMTCCMKSAAEVNENLMTPKGGSNGQILRRYAYITSYNKDTKIPNWVAWSLTREHTNGPHKRGGLRFEEDTDVPQPRATYFDYIQSGYSRGHMCPSADNRWNSRAQQESFLYTNCCPQLSSLNEGEWNDIEIKCRTWANKYGEIQIVCGPILPKGKPKTIGKNKVAVPEAFFKVVLCMKGNPKAIGFICGNGEDNQQPQILSVDDVERITGIDFFAALPDDIERRVEAEANINDWK